MSKQTDAVFTADPEGFREQNAGRPAAHLVREAVQNVFDEAATRLDVDVTWESGAGVTFRIVDDVPGGIRDERLIFTIWLSDKTDSPTKRGRMGRGLKELISVADETLILTEGGPATLFERVRGKWTRTAPRKHRPERGTIVEGRVKSWRKHDADAVVEYLRRMRAPEGLAFRVNGRLIERAPVRERYELKLPTVVFEVQEGGERAERTRTRVTTVELFHEIGAADNTPCWVYEMGIPIETIDFPMSIDVGQRVPLREKRDTLTDPYRRELYAKLLNVRLAEKRVPADELKDGYVMTATQAPEHLSHDAKVTVAEAWTEGKAYASTPDTVRAATGMHVPVVPLRALPQSIREIAKEVGTDARDVIKNMAVAACSTVEPGDYTSDERRLVEVWERIARGIRRPCRVKLATGRPSAAASFNRVFSELTVYTQVVGATFISRPLSADALSLLIHELAHWEAPKDSNSHGFEFHSDAEEVGGAVAAFLFEHGDELRGV